MTRIAQTCSAISKPDDSSEESVGYVDSELCGLAENNNHYRSLIHVILMMRRWSSTDSAMLMNAVKGECEI